MWRVDAVGCSAFSNVYVSTLILSDVNLFYMLGSGEYFSGVKRKYVHSDTCLA